MDKLGLRETEGGDGNMNDPDCPYGGLTERKSNERDILIEESFWG